MQGNAFACGEMYFRGKDGKARPKNNSLLERVNSRSPAHMEAPGNELLSVVNDYKLYWQCLFVERLLFILGEGEVFVDVFGNLPNVVWTD